MPEDQPITRTCEHCFQPKNIEDFPLTRGKRFFKCKACYAIDNKRWVSENREKSNGIKRAWIERNPERHAQMLRVCSSRESTKIRARERKRERRAELNRQTRELYATDPSKFKVRMQRREEREAAAEGVFTKEDEAALFALQYGRCANPKCGADLSKVRYHADHILALIHGGSHWPSNRQLLCVNCNHRKGSRTPEQWAEVIERWTA